MNRQGNPKPDVIVHALSLSKMGLDGIPLNSVLKVKVDDQYNVM